RGRGNIDIAGIGVLATISRRAKKIGCTPRTIQKNAQVYRLVREAQQINAFGAPLLPVLDEWGYWYAAASTAADPLAALLLFAQQKTSVPRFRVTDAYRLLSTGGTTKAQANTSAIAQVRDAARAALVVHLQESRDKIKSILETCPANETARDIYEPLHDVLYDI